MRTCFFTGSNSERLPVAGNSDVRHAVAPMRASTRMLPNPCLGP